MNCLIIRALMGEAALTAHVPLERVSFTGTRDAAYHYSQTIARIPAPAIAYDGAGSTPRCSPPSPPIWFPNDQTDANLAAKNAVPRPIPL